ncbi:homoserine kinase [Psychrobacillus lasiicapitis]|uniref:Homoserine kinase n=1 Tax=Psychrobacillus lasiicapitis TaxID=1636719 RepID=A0A544T585_9BACI|nr:homoserine kinase [Psychrobacillus lasiicapitis]TQR12612.1 homoserine kinase [Psychrobacillus lasiicapitis]GGA39519.1 homoserine kinase [Psychrobacillus lasiicapitis]
MSKRWSISIPASTANLGPGFDSIGIALDKYLELEVELASAWKIDNLSENLPDVPNPKDHLIIQAAEKTAELYGQSLLPCHLSVKSEIPLARGMGSSASAIVAGVELANQVLELELTAQDKLKVATLMEGHPDNAAASIFGGFTISSSADNGEIHVFHAYHIDASFVLFIPNFELKTEAARNVLPDSYTRQVSAQASATASLLTAAFLSQSFEQAGVYMEQDLFHEPYRLDLIPESREIKVAAKNAGAFGTCISGAGPTLLSLVQKGSEQEFISKLDGIFPNFQLVPVEMNRTGIVVKNKNGSAVFSN